MNQWRSSAKLQYQIRPIVGSASSISRAMNWIKAVQRIGGRPAQGWAAAACCAAMLATSCQNTPPPSVPTATAQSAKKPTKAPATTAQPVPPPKPIAHEKAKERTAPPTPRSTLTDLVATARATEFDLPSLDE